jgi:hypothetical protein
MLRSFLIGVFLAILVVVVYLVSEGPSGGFIYTDF